MTSFQLWRTRLLQNWKASYKLLQSVIDWLVIVYFIVPAFIIFIFVYRSWWIESPQWIEPLPLGFLFILAFLLSWDSHFHTFIREADRVFLRKSEKMILGLKQHGIRYSYLKQILTIGAICMIIAPIWVLHYELTFTKLALFACLWVSLKWVIMGIKGRLNIQMRGWRTVIKGVPIMIAMILLWKFNYEIFLIEQPLFIFSVFLVQVVFSFLLVRPRYATLRTLEQDIAIEQFQKNKPIEFIYNLSFDLEKLPKPKPIRVAPRLFKESNRIFKDRSPKNGFLELFIKVALRDNQYLLGYFKIISVTSAGIYALPPIWMKVGLMIVGSIFLASWVGNIWYKIFGGHLFTKKYTDAEGFLSGKTVATTFLMIPFMVIIIGIFLMRIYIFKQKFFF